jgi:hypothetical protein
MEPIRLTINSISVRNNCIKAGLSFSLCLILCFKLQSQTLVFGGFSSFAITDSTMAGANAGGAILSNDSRLPCLMVQGGGVFGQSELYNKIGDFKETCRELSKESGLKIYPNPGFGIYQIEGEVYRIEVFDYTGKHIANIPSYDEAGQIKKINISSHAEGTYLFKIYQNDGIPHVFSIIKLNSNPQ